MCRLSVNEDIVVDEYVGRCLDVGSTPTSSINTWPLFVYIEFIMKKLLSLTVLGLSLYSISCGKSSSKTEVSG